MTSPSDPSAHPATRAIELEVEVPGTPEQVWDAIATGPGISAWFVPAEVSPDGSELALHFGPGVDETGRITRAEPPVTFRYEAKDGDPPLAYEFHVEARAGGTCVVRLVNSGFGVGPEWDGQFSGMESGWRLFLHNLRLYLTHFPGQPCTSILVNGLAAGPVARAWPELAAALGVPADADEGQRVATGPGVPALGGVVERVSEGMLTLLLDTPGPGVALFAAEGTGEGVATSVYVYLFGTDATAVAARDEPVWRTWMESASAAP